MINRWKGYALFLILCFFCLSEGERNVAFATTTPTTQITATRSVPLTYILGGTISISLAVNVDDANKPNGVIIKEYVPSGWKVISSIPEIDTFDLPTGEIKWVFFGSAVVDRTIVYEVQIPDEESGTRSFNGQVLYNDPTGIQVINPIRGNTQTTMFLHYSMLTINSIPSGASILLDGATQSITVAPRTLTGLTPGTHTIKLTKPGYSNWSATITVTAESTTDITATLTLIPGSISITITPATATVLAGCAKYFTAQGYVHGNMGDELIPDLSFDWAVIGSIGKVIRTTGTSTIFIGSSTSGTSIGSITASYASTQSCSDISIVLPASGMYGLLVEEPDKEMQLKTGSNTVITIPANTFDNPWIQVIANDKPDTDKYESADQLSQENRKVWIPQGLKAIVREIKATEDSGQSIGTLTKPIMFTMSYPENIDPRTASRLRIYRLNTTINQWEQVSGQQIVNHASQTVTVWLNHLSNFRLAESPQEVATGTTKVTPSTINRQGTSTTTISTTFYDADLPAIGSLTITFKVKSPEGTETILVDNKQHGEAGLVVTGGDGTYTASYAWDPPEIQPLGLYDLYFSVSDGIGSLTDGYENNLDELNVAGTLSVTSTPPGADIYLDGTSTGTITPAILTGIILGTHTIKLTKAGYYDWTGTVTVSAEATIPVTATLTLITGSISVASTPTSANIWLDGVDKGTVTPATLTSIAPGTHTITLTKSGYHDWFGTVTVSTETTTNVTATMTLITGSISVASTPTSANIWLDGTSTGTITPAILTGIILGTHTITLTKFGYHDWFGTVTVSTETTTNVTATMTLITGSISVASTPTSANIWLDGTSTGTITPAILTGIILGTHTITLTKSGYHDWFGTITVTATTTDVAATMTLMDTIAPTFTIAATPDPAKAGTVTITVVSNEPLIGTPTVVVKNSGGGTITTTLTSVINSTNTYSAVITEGTLDGTATISVVGTDTANNQGTGSKTFQVSIPRKVIIIDGEGQGGTVTTTLNPFIVKVTDNLDRPISGHIITWQIASFPSPGSLSATTTITGEGGTATTILTLGTKSGTYKITANGGVQATFTATAIPTIATSTTVFSGNGQQGIVNTTLAPFVVKVTDTYGNPIIGHTINWTIVTSPATATLSATISITNADGMATTTLKLGANTGTYCVQAQGVMQATFTATAIPYVTAKTIISGCTISTNTTWTAANSPYLITGNVFVKGTNTPTLTIEPNVTIMFATNTSLIIGGSDSNDKGKLIANGSLGKITFTADGTTTAGYWGGIYFDNYSDDGSYLNNVVVEYGGYNCDANIYCISASPSIQDSIIGSSSQHGIRCNNSSPQITNNIITNNTSHGILLEGISKPVIVTNTITKNNDGIYCSGNGSSPTITTNKIIDNTSYPVYIGANSVCKVFNNTYSGNTPDAIYVFGEIIDTSGTWVNNGVSYIITGDVFVKGTNTPTLTIASNVTIRFATKTSLYIGGSGSNDKGKLIADGSLGKITFTADGTTTAGYWGGIYFDNYSDDGSYLKNIVVEYGGYNCDADIYCVSASPSIQDSIIGSSSQHGIRCNNSSPQITNNIITNNTSHGILLEGISYPTIATNTITCNNYGIYCNDTTSQPIMQNNIIATNTTAMRITPVDFSNNTITGTTTAKIEILGGNITTNRLWKNFNDSSSGTYTYVILGNISVKGAATPTLTIASNVTIMFATNTSLIIGGPDSNDKGKLIADGSIGTISFTSNQATHTAGYWGCIGFDNYSDDGSYLKNVVVEYGGNPYDANIYCINASPLIQNSTIRNSSKYGIGCENSSPMIATCTIKDNSSHGIYLEGSSSPTIAMTTITYNNYGIYCNDTNSQPIMQNNTIATNTTAMRISPNTDFSTNTITGTTTAKIEILGGNITTNRLWKNFNDSSSGTYTYVILGNISVKGVATPILTIASNVMIRFATNTSLIIGGTVGTEKGKLIADGSIGTISFTSNQATHTAGYWGCIYFDNYSDDGSYLKNVVVEYGGYNYNANIYCISASPSIQNSIIRNSSQHGICLQSNSNPFIATNTVTDNNSYGIYCNDTSPQPVLENNTIANNATAMRITPNTDFFNNTISGNIKKRIELLGGNITNNRIWKDFNYTYVILGTVSVKGTDTPILVIAPNVTIMFATNTSLIIGGSGINAKGKLMADGSSGTISFTSDEAIHTAGYWGGIIFDNYSDDGIWLRNIVVEHGGYNYNANIYCINASPTIQDSIIGSSSQHGIRCNNSSPQIINNIIKDNSSHGIYLEGSSKPRIATNTITNNNSYGIYCNDNSPQPVLENNTIATNTTAMRISPNTDFSTNTIHGNINKRIELLGGNITNDKFWKDFDYTYVILGTVSVKGAGNPTLTIEPSVEVRFATNTSLIIGGSGINDKGKLIADGSSETITFTSDQATHTAGYWGWHTAGYWGCIYFDKYSDDESNLKNIVVEYGGYNYNANIYCINASPTIQDSIIGSSSQHGIRCNNSSPQIINNIIKDNSSHGIYLEGSSKPRIATNTVTGNNYGIYCNDSGPQPTMENNTIATNTTAMRISPNTDFFNNVIYGNINKRIDILGGNITNNRIWKNFDYTYVILGTVSVKGTDTPILVIEPSVTIMFATNTSLIIGGSGINDKGKLMADGSLGTISFTSNQAIHTAGYWGGIYFEDYSNDNSILDTAVIEYGGYAYGTNIYCVNASPKIQNSIIGSSSQYGIRCNNSSPLISNDLIKNNRSHGVCLQGDSDPTITASTITGNDYGIYCAVVNSSPLIATNTITDNKSYPVRIGANSVRQVYNNTCSNNTLNAIYLLGETIDTSETWASNGVPYVIGGNVSVMGAGTPTLTIEPTVEVRFAQNTCLIIGGTVGTEKGRLIADGSLGTILFTSNQVTHTAGYWGCILFNNYSDDESLLRNVVVEYGGRNTYATNIYCVSASPSIQNSIIRNSSGHGIRCNNSFSLMTNDIINNNLFNGIYLEKFSTSTITNNLISWNGYSGIHCISSSPNVYNNIIVQNGTKSSSYNGIRVVTNGTPIIDFNDVWGNGLTANYYGCGTGTTDISANPQFIGGVDFHLASTSPCINKGWNTAPGIPLTDKDGRARIIGGTVDMGAYEYGTTPPPTTGTLNVISSPTGVNIFIDGINKVKTTPAVLSLEAGTYILLLTKPNYDPCTATVTINIGSITQIYGTLTPCYGTLSVTSTPTGASIFIDGVDKGTATPAVLSLQTGSYTLSLTMPNYCTYTTPITIGSSSPASISATLLVYSVGTLSVTSNPTGASIFIDGSNIGTTTPAELSLQVGSHTLSLTKLNYYSYTTTTTIGSSSITHHGTLAPYPPVAIISAPLRPVKVNDSVTIDGTKSYAANGNPVTYFWKQIDGTISGTTSTIIFTPTKAGTYAFELTVTDDMEASGSATVSVSVTDTLLTISPVTPEIGSSFSVDVILSKVPEFDAIGVYLSFDPNMLEVIKLTPGAFPVGGSQIMPQFNNDNGTIDYAVVLLGTTTQGSGTIFTINFKAKTITGTTTLNFDFNPPRNTVILKGAGSVPVAIIEGSVPITDVLYGSLDGFVQFDIRRKTPSGIEVTIDGTDLGTITDKDGYFLIEKISPMIYQKISAYAPGASTRYWGSVTITVGTKTTLSILTLLNADVNGDCSVDLIDFGYFKSAFLSGTSSPCGTSSSGWNDSGTHTRDGYINADFNGDGMVSLMDFGYFKSNYLKATPSQRSPLFAPPLTLSNSVNILTTPILKVVQQEKVVKMGDEFDVNIDLLHAPDFDSVGVYLSFDPNRLEVIGITQGLLLQGGSPIVSRFNDVSGTIDYAVGLISGTAQGTGTVLTIKLKAKGTGTTTLNFDFNPPRSIEILNGTTSVPCSTQGGTTIIIELLGSSSSGILIAGDGKTRVEIDTGAITGAGYIEIDTSGISDDPIVIIANTKNDADTRINRIKGTLRRFEIHDATITTTATVRIAIPYLDENPKDGVVDGTGIQVSSLKICWLTGTGTDATWWPVKNSWIDYTNSLVYANVSHFSYYVLMGSVMPTLTFVYPNPCLGQQVHFKGLTPHATIKIFNIAGELVKEIEHTNGTDEEVWTFSCEIASGIYIYLITDPVGNRKTGKIGVIR